MRGFEFLFALLTAAQGVKEERGVWRLSAFGQDAGAETYCLSEFENGSLVLTSRVKFEVEIAGQKRGYDVDTSLTMGPGFAPVRYAGYHKAGREEKLLKLEWEKGSVVPDKGKSVPSKAAHLLDSNTLAQLLPILRSAAFPRKAKVFRLPLMQDQDLAIEDRGEQRLEGPAGAVVRVRELRVSAGYLDLTLHVDDRSRILRAWHIQTEVLAELEGYAGWKPVPPPPAGTVEEEIVVRSGDVLLAGTVTRPKAPGKVHGVLILGASGPQDRHGNVVPGKEGLERFAWEGPDVGLYREISAALSAAGLLVLRLDDRGCGKSGGAFPTARLADFEADAEAAARALRARGDVDRLLLLGHDEGGLVSLRLAPRVGAAGVLLLATPSRTLDLMLLDAAERQLRAQGTAEALIARILEKERATYARIRGSTEDWLEVDERRTFVGWMRDRFTLDPLKAGGTPWAVFHGTADEVVPIQDAARWGVVRQFQGLDHVFRRPGGPVDPAFLKALADEAAARLKAGS